MKYWLLSSIPGAKDDAGKSGDLGSSIVKCGWGKKVIGDEWRTSQNSVQTRKQREREGLYPCGKTKCALFSRSWENTACAIARLVDFLSRLLTTQEIPARCAVIRGHVT